MLAASAGLAGCADDVERASGELALTNVEGLWVDVSLDADDPFAERAPSMRECSLAGWLVEADGTEVDTGLCNFVSLQQPTLLDARRGDALRVVFFHFDLTSPEPAEGFAALALGDEVVWTYETRIPGPAGYFDEVVELERGAPAGTPLTFHIDNHGQNTWKLGLLQLNP